MKYKFLISLLALIAFVKLFSTQTLATDWTVCPTGGTGGGTCSHTGPEGIQQAIDEAKDGDSIIIQAGKYEKEDQRNPYIGPGIKSCFVYLKGKNINLVGVGSPKGEWNGTVLFGGGHDTTAGNKPGVETSPNYSRAGICSNGGSVTISSIHVKEFEGGCMNFTDTKVVIKNSVIDGCDHGGVHFSGNSSVMTVNSYYVAVIGLQPSNGASVKAINNVFWGKAIDYSCNEPEIPPIDFINNTVSDIEETIGIGWITSTCPEKSAGFKTQNIKYNVFWKDSHPCYPHEYCDWTQPNNANKNINADPLLDQPAIDQRGWRWGGDFSPKPGSPAIGSGDPSIPGTKDIGGTGGPCVDPASTACTQYIAANPPRDPIAPAAEIQPPGNNQNNQNNTSQQTNPFGIPIPLSRLIVLPNNVSLPSIISNTKALSSHGEVFSLFTFIILSVVYIMFMHLAINMGSEFSLGMMVAFFILGGAVGGILHTYESGFVLAAILSLLFIGGPKKEM